MVFDLPAHPPRGPSGEINTEQLEYEYHRPTMNAGAGVPNGYRYATNATFQEYLNAVVQNDKGAL
jgi:hypothetical protein